MFRSSKFFLLHYIQSYLFQTWETRYILLLWLSIICLVPFDMARFDGVNESNKDSVSVVHQKPVVDRIIDMAKVSEIKKDI